MPKKLTSLADLAKMKFDNLAPDPEPNEIEDDSDSSPERASNTS